MKNHALLFHNQEAGFETYSSETLAGYLAGIGYDTTVVDTKSGDWKGMTEKEADLIVIAGGDGTVGKVAKRYVGSGIDIGILPLGTANNVATSLGISGKPKDIIAGWDMKNPKGFDVGVVGKNEKYFVESVGFGLIPRLIRAREEEESKSTRERELDDAVAHQLDILKGYKAHACTIELEDETLTGDYLMVEVMNTRFVGPNLCLAPHADFSDGMLDVVLVTEGQRDLLAEYLQNCLRGEDTHHKLPVHRSAKVRITWGGKYYHRDDKTLRNDSPVKLDIHLEKEGLSLLV